MGLIYKLAQILEESRAEYLQSKAEIYSEVACFGHTQQDKRNLLAYGNNLQWMNYLKDHLGMEGNLQLIYVDPPFYSKADYFMSVKIESEKLEEDFKIKQTVYTDTWNKGIEDYLKMIAVRLFVMRDLLSDEGCVWIHLDWHVAHYVKLLMDEIFGENNFVNEIIWTYKSGGTSNRRFSRKHDTLLFYSKTDRYYFNPQKEKSYNRGFKPYRFKGVTEYEDEQGWYTMVNMKDVWQIDMVGRTSAERTGYATQKPELLLSRILESCTREGDLCADFFGGSGTLAAAASRMNRRWISCDIGLSSIANIQKRLLSNEMDFSFFIQDNECFENPDGEIEVKFQSCTDDMVASLELTLLHYQPSEKWLEALTPKDKTLIEAILKEDSMSLIEFWSVDTQYNGKVHQPQEIIFKTKGCLERKVVIHDTAGVIHIICVDVFGNRVAKTING
ncbi:DNA methyltransferase [Clostridium aminobutyricum]|uniref:Site-specific DNA-methyltransferase n=1 Tax=Clostridium aminobutyricum TaxID=33953 RepID=A0A939IIA1_CLOAM|nr:site-specific DNA-methyltransferase [Clostridium aminobutyricum]MBN7772856.1 site-specific DNA-methyltransferase [Clostridium aminobutyricum]